jgi:hypothetical protein
MTLANKLKLTSRLFRYFVWFIMGLVPALYLLLEIYRFDYVHLGVFHFDLSNNFLNDAHKIWQKSHINFAAFALFLIPKLCLPFLSLYWLQRLFGLYAKGDFFSNNVTNLFLALVWTHFILSIYQPLFDGLIVPYLEGEEKFTILYTLSLGRVFTFAVILFFIYIHRLANKIEKENREFI